MNISKKILKGLAYIFVVSFILDLGFEIISEFNHYKNGELSYKHAFFEGLKFSIILTLGAYLGQVYFSKSKSN